MNEDTLSGDELRDYLISRARYPQTLTRDKGLIIGVIDIARGDSGKALGVAWLLRQLGIRHVVRFQGGMNSGHNLTLPDGTKLVIHLVPAGTVLGGVGMIGPYCVMMPYSDGVIPPDQTKPRAGFREEVEALQAGGIMVNPRTLVVDPYTSVTCPWHLELEGRSEGGKNKIGTTGRGIGRTYEFLHGRCRVSVAECMEEHLLDQALSRVKRELRNRLNADELIEAVQRAAAAASAEERGWLHLDAGTREVAIREAVEAAIMDPFEHKEDLLAWGKWLKSVASIERVGPKVQRLQDDGKDVLFEGAQGALLDVVYSQPWCTSSTIWPPVGFGQLRNCISIGIFKAVPTYVGDAPAPTEMLGEGADALRDKLGEYGATTGRPRRLLNPWMAAIREGIARTKVDMVMITKLDPLVGHELTMYNGIQVEGLPANVWWQSEYDAGDMSQPNQCSGRVQAIGQFALPVIDEDFTGVTKQDDLPDSVLAFVAQYADRLPVPIAFMKTGPNTEDMCPLPGLDFESLDYSRA